MLNGRRRLNFEEVDGKERKVNLESEELGTRRKRSFGAVNFAARG